MYRKLLISLSAALVLFLTLPVRTESGVPTNEAAAGEAPLLSFAVISDVHVQAWNQRAIDKLARALTDVHGSMPQADALVVNGDLGNGLPADYAAWQSVLARAKLPPNVWWTIGNHEYYKAWYDQKGNWSPATFPNGETEQASRKRFLTFTGLERLYYDRWLNGYHFIMLGSEQYRQSNPANKEDAALSAEQLDWLKITLSEHETLDKPVFVFLHQPLPDTVAGSKASPDTVQNAGIQEELLHILSAHPQIVLFTGHSHWELKLPDSFVRREFTMVNTSSVYEPYDQKDKPYDQAADHSEGVYVYVYNSKIVCRGRDFARAAWIPEARLELLVPQPKKMAFHS